MRTLALEVADHKFRLETSIELVGEGCGAAGAPPARWSDQPKCLQKYQSRPCHRYSINPPRSFPDKNKNHYQRGDEGRASPFGSYRRSAPGAGFPDTQRVFCVLP
jgi:hypothetical protein